MLSSDNNSLKRDANEAIIWYGLGVLVLGGGAGVWLPLLMPGKTVGADGLATYVFAVLVPLLADAILVETYWRKLAKTTKTKLFFFAILAAFLAVIALIRDSKQGDITAGVSGAVIAVIIWFSMTRYSGRFEPSVKKLPTGSLGAADVSPSHLEGGGLK